MKLVVKDEHKIEHVIHGITLDRGITPTLNTLSDDDREAFRESIPDIEPAVWFKILILECVTIDCINRLVTWYSTTITEESKQSCENKSLLRDKKSLKRISDSTYLLSEHAHQYGMDFDLVFVETKEIVQNYVHAKVNAVPFASIVFYKEMFSVLHRYVLPAITLTKEDMPQLTAALEYQHLLIKRQDQAICDKHDASKVVSDKQGELREQYFEEIVAKQDGDRLNFPADISMLLYNHVQEDLSHFSQQLTEAQTDVNLVKESIKELTPTHTKDREQSTKPRARNARASIIVTGTPIESVLNGNESKECKPKCATESKECKPKCTTESTECKPKCATESTECKPKCATESKECKPKCVTESKGIPLTGWGDGTMTHYDINDNSESKLDTEINEVSKQQDELSKFRAIRDKIFERYKTILQVREILGEYVSDRVIVQKDNKKKVTRRQIIRSKLKKLKKSKRKTQVPKHVRYVELETEKQDKMNETSFLVEEKVQMISVKEGIKSAIEDLKTESVAFGVDFNHKGSVRATDVRKKRPALPQWLSLSEQIAQELENPSSDICKLYRQASQRVVMQCVTFQKLHKKYLLSESDSPDNLSLDSNTIRGVFEQSKLSFYGSSGRGDSAIPLPSIRRKSKGSGRNGHNYRESCVYSEREGEGYGLTELICVAMQQHPELDCAYEPSDRYNSLVEMDGSEELEDVVIVHDTSPEYAQTSVDNLKQDIKKHMNQMCIMLQCKLSGGDNHFEYQKVWTCYEKTFFAEIMYNLEQLYELAYADVLNGLQESLPKLTPYTLAMDNQVILKLFEDIGPGDDMKLTDFLEHEVKGLSIEDSSDWKQDSSASDLNIARSEHMSSASDLNIARSEHMSSASDLNMGRAEHMSSASDLNMGRAENMSSASDLNMARAEHMSSASDLNMAIAEHMIGLKIESAPRELYSPISQTDGECFEAKSHNVSDRRAKSHNYPDLKASIGAESDATPSPNLDESVSSTKDANRSKYTNVLDQINFDYARQVEKNIDIYYPLSVNFWSDERNTWPLLSRREEDIEFASDAIILQHSKQGLNGPTGAFASRRTFTSQNDFIDISPLTTPQLPLNITQVLNSKSVRIQEPYLSQLDGVVKQLRTLCSVSTPTAKLQCAFRALHELANQVKSFHTQIAGRVGAIARPSADDLTDFLVVLLCNCDMALVKSLYINVQIMRDHIQEDMEIGPLGFALMQLTICLHFLQERIVMQRGLIENHEARLSSGLY